jgi:hypothetical protein
MVYLDFLNIFFTIFCKIVFESKRTAKNQIGDGLFLAFFRTLMIFRGLLEFFIDKRTADSCLNTNPENFIQIHIFRKFIILSVSYTFNVCFKISIQVLFYFWRLVCQATKHPSSFLWKKNLALPVNRTQHL